MHKKTGNFWSKIFSGPEESSCPPPQPEGDAFPLELEALQEILAVLPEASAPGVVAGACLQRTVELLGLKAAVILAPGSDEAPSIFHQFGLPVEANDAEAGDLILACRQVAGQSFQQKRSAWRAQQGNFTLVAVPYPQCDCAAGAVVFVSQAAAPLSEESLPLLHLVGQAIGAALTQAQLYEQLHQETALRQQAEQSAEKALETARQQQGELALYTTLLNAVANAPDSQALLSGLCQALVECLQATQSAAALLNESGDTLMVVAEYIPAGRAPGVGILIPVQNNPASLFVIKQKAPLALNDAQHDILLAPVHEIMELRGVASLLLVPILDRGRVIGTLGIDSAERREFTPREIELAMQTAAIAARAIGYLPPAAFNAEAGPAK